MRKPQPKNGQGKKSGVNSRFSYVCATVVKVFAVLADVGRAARCAMTAPITVRAREAGHHA